jgi:hypothetical protein
MAKAKLSKKMYFVIFLSTFFVMLVVTLLIRPSGEVHIYSFPGSNSSKTLSAYFNSKSGLKVISYSLDNPSYSSRFLEILYVLMTKGVEITPPVCVLCELSHGMTMEEIYLSYCSPLIVFFRNGRLTAITIATTDYNVLNQALLMDDEEHVEIFMQYKTFNLTSEDDRVQIEKILLTKKD